MSTESIPEQIFIRTNYGISSATYSICKLKFQTNILIEANILLLKGYTSPNLRS